MSTKTNTTPVDVTKISKGSVHVSSLGGDVYTDSGRWLASAATSRTEYKHNAAMIAEAFNVANKTGLSPLQMQERLDEAVRLLRSAGRALNHEAKCHLLERGAIGKSETCEYYVKGINAFLSTLTKHP